MPELNRLDPERPRGVVLMLHGGAARGTDPVSRRSASLWRTRLMRDVLRPRLLEEGLALWLLRFSVRGWNADGSAEPSPVTDARWALAEIAREHPGLPVVLLGHSMGARTAVHVADAADVAGVVALAPWFGPRDPVRQLTGRRLVAGHGSRDRITSPAATRHYVRRAAGVAERAQFVDMGPLGHYMLHRAADWNRFALRSTLAVLDRG